MLAAMNELYAKMGINPLDRFYNPVKYQPLSKHRNQRKGMKSKQVAKRRAQERNRRQVNKARR